MEICCSGYKVPQNNTLYLQANFCSGTLWQSFRVFVQRSVFIWFVEFVPEGEWAPN